MKIKRFTIDKLKRKARYKFTPEKKTDFRERDEIIRKFHKLFFEEGLWVSNWFGFEIQKYPTDLMIYQEIINETKPDVIIETGTNKGGSALYFAHLFDIRGYGKVITIDINKRDDFPKHNRIKYLTGRSDNKRILDYINFHCSGKKVMVILDSDHDYKTVLNELKNYSEFVSVGCYLIVEDTNINGHPVEKNFGKGSWEAVHDFLEKDRCFITDQTRERFLITANPNGFLKKVREDTQK
jgi:cephalosporin hydroxylase